MVDSLLPRPSPAAGSRSASASTVLAALLLLVSLGLPWGHSLSWSTRHHAGWMTPMLCRTVQAWDGWYESVCDPGFVSAGWTSTTAERETSPGAAHASRFGVVAGLVLIALAWRQRRRRWLLLAAAVVAVMTVLTAGLGFGHAGASAAWLAVALLASNARR
jgi:hypothetical protein